VTAPILATSQANPDPNTEISSAQTNKGTMEDLEPSQILDDEQNITEDENRRTKALEQKLLEVLGRTEQRGYLQPSMPANSIG
jgi:hypothetical protein